jgi:hypothetical protein
MGNLQKLVAAAVLLAASPAHAEISGASASVRSNNSLIVDIQVRTGGSATQVFVTYQTQGVDPLVSRLTPVSNSGLTTITIGRLRASRTYTYTVGAIDDHGGPAGRADGSFTTGALPPVLLRNPYTLQGRTTVPLVIYPHVQTIPGVGTFRGYVALDLHASDAPQIVWYYSNAPSTASGVLQVDGATAVVQEPNGNFLFVDSGSGGPTAADPFYRVITPDGTILDESPADCRVTPPPASPAPPRWVWGQGNDTHEQLLPGADGVLGTVLHLGKVVKDPFFDAGLARPGERLQLGTTIRRWDPSAGTDTVVWDPFDFLDPLHERTSKKDSDPGANSDFPGNMVCAGTLLPMEEWTHSNSLQVAPTGEILQSVRHLDTVIAISPLFDRIAWRIGRFRSDFTFPNPSDTFYHQHFVRMLDSGNLLLFDNGNGRPKAEGGLYSRALELALDWTSRTATKVWEYRHQLTTIDGAPVYKYADKVGSAARLENGNTLIMYGADIDPTTLLPRDPQTFTLVEADPSPEANALAVLDMQIAGATAVYRALPVNTLFGEAPCAPPVISGASATPSVLWPPNHHFVDVTVDYSDGFSCPATCALSVTSNEPPDGDQEPEWIIVDAHHVRLRAERRGSGSGRIYSITITCTNAAGAASQTITVLVPHDQGH